VTTTATELSIVLFFQFNISHALRVEVSKRDVWVLRAARAAEANGHFNKKMVFIKGSPFMHKEEFIAQDTTPSVTWLEL